MVASGLCGFSKVSSLYDHDAGKHLNLGGEVNEAFRARLVGEARDDLSEVPTLAPSLEGQVYRTLHHTAR